MNYNIKFLVALSLLSTTSFLSYSNNTLTPDERSREARYTIVDEMKNPQKVIDIISKMNITHINRLDRIAIATDASLKLVGALKSESGDTKKILDYIKIIKSIAPVSAPDEDNDAGFFLNLHWGDGETLVQTAARIGHADVLPSLIKAGANVNKKTWDGRTALQLLDDRRSKLPLAKKEKIVKILRDAGAK